MERGFWIVITIVLSMPIWLLMYDELVPDVINETNTIYVEPDLDCAECIEVCHGTTYEGVIESAYNTTEIIIPVVQEMDTHKQMQEDHMNYIHRDKNILNRLSRWFGGNL